MKYKANPVIVDAYKIIEVKEPRDSIIPLILDNGETVEATQEMIARMIPTINDYWVIQSDGYIYLNPADVFERKYTEVKE